MRLTSVSMYSDNTEMISFSVRDADPSALYMVRGIIGLDADEIVPKFYGFGLQNRPRFYDFGLKARELVLRVILNPRFRLDETYSDIRDELYRAISSNRTGLITLHFNSGATLVSRIFGFITKFEVGYFSKLPEVQITIRCDDPMFRAVNPVRYDNDDLLKAMATPTDFMIPDSLSTAPHGFQFEATFKSAVPQLTIQNVPDPNAEWKFNVIPNGGFLAGDVLYFSSEYSNKYLYIMRGASTIPMLDRIQPGSMWPIIFPGANDFYVAQGSEVTWNKLEWYAAYWGI